MESDNDKSVWDSRFAESTGVGDSGYASQGETDSLGPGSILEASAGLLPQVSPAYLKFDCVLGLGSNFRVTREIHEEEGRDPYFVAVKHVLRNPTKPSQQRSRFSGIIRELKVLTYPPLSSHGYLATMLAYGWTNDGEHEGWPYLVMDYAEFGSLRSFLQRCLLPPNERLELALDVAEALQSLHDCHIIHGDVKIDNVLVYACHDDDSDRDQIARIADFGCSHFRHDLDRNPILRYTGTPLYNAPELDTYTNIGIDDMSTKFEAFKAADCYSYGLLMLEVVKNGEHYWKKWLKPADSVSDFINKHRPEGFIKAALSFLENLIDCYVTPMETSYYEAMKDAMSLAMIGDPKERGSLSDISNTLSSRSTMIRPKKSGKRNTHVRPWVPRPNLDRHLRPANPNTWWQMLPPQSENLNLRLITGDSAPSPGSGSLVRHQIAIMKSRLRSRTYTEKPFSMFDIWSARVPPWAVQEATALQTLRAVDSHGRTQTPASEADYHLQLSVMYHLGFGIIPSNSETLLHLQKAARHNNTAACLLLETAGAIVNLDTSLLIPPEIRAKLLSHTAASTLAHSVQKLLARQHHASERISMLTEHSSLDDRDTSERLRADLVKACQEGKFQESRRLIQVTPRFPASHQVPTPVHWMIAFPPKQSRTLLDLLFRTDMKTSPPAEGPGICASNLDSLCEYPVKVPEYCMELIGTPLHWAVRCGNLELVKMLVDLGACVNVRVGSDLAHYIGPKKPRQPNLSPLDIAVMYHFYDIAEFLLENNAELCGGDIQWSYSCLHMIGVETIPFARYAAHGSKCRNACRQTLELFIQEGLSINEQDSIGRTPLRIALANVDVERYILEELLTAGAVVCGQDESKHTNAAAIAAQASADRPFNSWKLSLVLTQVEDLNALDSTSSLQMNALHYCAVLDSAEYARVLIAQPRIDLQYPSSSDTKASGKTALIHAAIHGSVAVARILLEAGAEITTTDSSGTTALEYAVTNRNMEVADLLLEKGAPILFYESNGQFDRTVLHVAVMGATRQLSAVKRVLSKLSPLAIKETIDVAERTSFTALHLAAYCGDIEGVEALLEAGANKHLSPLPQFSSLGATGGTPLQLVIRTLQQFQVRGFVGAHHKKVVEAGEVAIQNLHDSLLEVRKILSRY